MESNTTPAPQRRRRSASALPSELPLVVPPEYLQPSPAPSIQPSQAAPVSAPQTESASQVYPPYSAHSVPAPTSSMPKSAAYQPRTSVPSNPQYPRTGASCTTGTPPPQRSPHTTITAQRTGRPVAQQVQGQACYTDNHARPAAQSPARSAAQYTCAAGARPQAYGEPNLFRREQTGPQQKKHKHPPQAAPAIRDKSSVKASSIPSWMWTLFSMLLIAVLGISAFSAVRMAQMKTKADEFQQAWENMLYNYHVTEQADGTFRVTWQEYIERYAAMYNLDPAFVTAVIRNESSFRTDATSSVGARGLMQMMPDTAEWIADKLGEPFDFDRLYEAETSIHYGCWYLNFLSELFNGDTVLVCAAYHAGQGEVLGWLGKPSISPDGVNVPIQNIPISNTKTYAGRVTQAYGIYRTLLYSPDPAAAAAVYGADPSVVGDFTDR